MIVLDSSVLVSFFNEEDSNHEKAAVLMRTWQDGGARFIVCDYAALETATVLRNKSGLDKAVLFLEFIKNADNVQLMVCTFSDFEATCSVFREQKSRISLGDAAVIYFAASTNSGLGTFDEAQKKEFERVRSGSK